MIARKKTRKKVVREVLMDLTQFSIFAGMSEDQVNAIKSRVVVRSHPQGETIWRENDAGDDVVLLLRGEVDITHRLTLLSSQSSLESRDKSLIHLTAEMHPVIGEIALCASTPRSATLTASTDVMLGVLRKADLEEVARNDPNFGVALYKNLSAIISRRLIETNANVLKLTTAFSLALEQEG
jgi:CRP/FNR family cyclic AMP-dependent transcriptional regulator